MPLINTQETDGNEFISDFHFPTSKKAIIIFTRNPELGTCKTRLAKTIGDEAALDIYKFLINHTANTTKTVVADKHVFYSEKIKKNDLWDDNIFIKKLQNGDNLGMRMENAFIDLFQSGYQKIIIVGSDLLDLTTNHINQAFEELNHTDVVFGPALDGGYYLLGLQQLHEAIFQNKTWGTPSVLQATLADLKQQSVQLLETLNDIDTLENLQRSNYILK